MSLALEGGAYGPLGDTDDKFNQFTSTTPYNGKHAVSQSVSSTNFRVYESAEKSESLIRKRNPFLRNYNSFFVPKRKSETNPFLSKFRKSSDSSAAGDPKKMKERKKSRKISISELAYPTLQESVKDEVALLRDPKYVESMLARDSCCLQGAVVSSFSCICGFWGHVFMCIFGLIGFGYWVYKIVVDSNSNKSNDLDFVVNILTALGFFFFSLYTIYATAVNQTKILALLLSEFQRKLDVLDLINGRLEMTQVRLKRTQEALDMTQENFTQTHQEYVRVKDELNDSNGYLRETQMKMQDTENKLEAQVLEFGYLIEKDKELAETHSTLNEDYRSNTQSSAPKLLCDRVSIISKF